MTVALVTNDDGVDAAGLHVLASVAVAAGLETFVAAPADERSGASASLVVHGSDGGIAHSRRALPGLDITVHAVDASPAAIVRAVLSGALGPPPDLVLSGANHGPNTGTAILHSGTVGAALTAASLGTRALAVSADVGTDGLVHHWDTVAHVAGAVLDRFLASDAAVVGLNVPDVVPAALRGVVAAELAPVGAVEARVTERGDDRVTVVDEPIPAAGTDARLLAEGWATVTALSPVATDPRVDPAGLVPGPVR